MNKTEPAGPSCPSPSSWHYCQPSPEALASGDHVGLRCNHLTFVICQQHRDEPLVAQLKAQLALPWATIVHITTGLYLQILRHVLAVNTRRTNCIDTLSLQVVEKPKNGVPVIGMHLLPLSKQTRSVQQVDDNLWGCRNIPLIVARRYPEDTDVPCARALKKRKKTLDITHNAIYQLADICTKGNSWISRYLTLTDCELVDMHHDTCVLVCDVDFMLSAPLELPQSLVDWHPPGRSVDQGKLRDNRSITVRSFYKWSVMGSTLSWSTMWR